MLRTFLEVCERLRVVWNNTVPMLRSEMLIRQGIRPRELVITRLQRAVIFRFVLEGGHKPVDFRIPLSLISQPKAYTHIADVLAQSDDLPSNVDRDALCVRYRTELASLVAASAGTKLILGPDGSCRRG